MQSDLPPSPRGSSLSERREELARQFHLGWATSRHPHVGRTEVQGLVRSGLNLEGVARLLKVPLHVVIARFQWGMRDSSWMREREHEAG